MNVVIIYESLTGNTRRAAEIMAAAFRDRGADAHAYPTTAIDLRSLEDADVVVVGGWTDGFIFVGQRPGRAGRLRSLPSIRGKRAFVYCTYAIDLGKTLEKLVEIVEGLGADVVGGRSIRRDRVEEGALAFVDDVMASLEEAGAS